MIQCAAPKMYTFHSQTPQHMKGKPSITTKGNEKHKTDQKEREEKDGRMVQLCG